MRRLDATLALVGAAVTALVFVAIQRPPEGVTPARLEQAVAPTFANLVRTQRSRLGLPNVDRVVLGATARCQKVGATSARDARGGGDWTCTVSWTSPGRRVPLRDAYELSVTPDGCYTATAEGSEEHVGGRTLTTRDGATLTNLLYSFEGCFDTTGAARGPRATGKD